VRDSKGEKDRITLLPQGIIEPLKLNFARLKKFMKMI
jgi:hypothetical protein